MIVWINFFILLNILGTTRAFRGVLLFCGTRSHSKMATQKTMRGFFAVQKDSMSSSSKKLKVEAVSAVVVTAASVTSSTPTSSSSASATSTDPDQSGGNTDKAPEYPPSLTDEEWKSKLSQEFSKPYFKTLTEFVDKEYEKVRHHPVSH